MLKHRPIPPLIALGLLLPLWLGGCAALPRPGPAQHQEPKLARAHFIASDGTVLPVRSWLPKGEPKAVIVCLHGFNDYSRAFEPPGRYLGEHGLAVYAYDQRGFGLAPGRGRWAGIEAYTHDLAEFVAQIRKRHGKTPLYLLGESMGGAVALVALTSPQPPDADGAILSAPAVWARDTMPWYQRALLSITAHMLPELELTGSGLKVQASDNIPMLIGLGRDPLVIKATRADAIAGLADLMDAAQQDAAKLDKPVLVLYGAKDEIIPQEPIRLMLGKLPKTTPARIGYYEGGYHLLLRDLGAERPWADIAAWAVDHGGVLPSGADLKAAALRPEAVGNSGAWTGQGGAAVGKPPK